MEITLWIEKRKSDENLIPAAKADHFFPVSLGNVHTVPVLGHYDKNRAREMFHQINRIRRQRNAVPLRRISACQNFAAVRALEASYLFDHERPCGLAFSMGENLAMCSEISANRKVLDSWCQEPGHFANIIDTTYTCTGIACFLRQRDGGSYEEYWSQIFC